MLKSCSSAKTFLFDVQRWQTTIDGNRPDRYDRLLFGHRGLNHLDPSVAAFCLIAVFTKFGLALILGSRIADPSYVGRNHLWQSPYLPLSQIKCKLIHELIHA